MVSLTSSLSRVRELTDSSVEFGLIPKEHWYQPDWIDEKKASESRQKMADNNVIYGGKCSGSVTLSVEAELISWIGSLP